MCYQLERVVQIMADLQSVTKTRNSVTIRPEVNLAPCADAPAHFALLVINTGVDGCAVN